MGNGNGKTRSRTKNFKQMPNDEVVDSGEHLENLEDAPISEGAIGTQHVEHRGALSGSPSEIRNPYMTPEDQTMEMKPQVVGPPAYASPNPATSAGRLVPLSDHPLNAEKLGDEGGMAREAAISEDYGAAAVDVTNSPTASSQYGLPGRSDLERDTEGSAEDSYGGMTVEQLKDLARDREIEGFSSMKKDELVAAHEEYDTAAGGENNNDE